MSNSVDIIDISRPGSRVISWLCETEWPASLPDLALNDFLNFKKSEK